MQPGGKGAASCHTPTGPSLALPAFLAIGLGLGCATVYQPAGERAPQSGPAVSADLTRVRGRAVVISLKATKAASVGVPRLALTSDAPCQAGIELEWGPEIQGLDANGRVVDVLGARELEVRLRRREPLLRHGLVIELPVESQDDGEEECLRLPLTAPGDEILWRATPRRWDAGMAFRVEQPTDFVGVVGTTVTVEARLVRPTGRLRPAVALDFGFATCWQDCPGLPQGSSWIDRLYMHLGTVVSVDLRIPLGRWALDVGPGVSARFFAPVTGDDSSESRATGQLGVRGSFRLMIPSPALPGFSPQDRFASGPELFVERRYGSGGGAGAPVFIVGAGWNWGFEGPL
jgi:hypothetical protein